MEEIVGNGDILAADGHDADDEREEQDEITTTYANFSDVRGDGRIQESDGHFFEDFTALSWKQENRRLQAARQNEAESEQLPPSETEVGVSPQEFKIGKREWEDLYVEVLYTIKHKLGADGGAYSAYTSDLYDYAREAFRMSEEDHQRLMAVAQDEKPPIPVLNVVVVEAQGLEAKDPNGFSDPYCMLGIQPGNASTESRRNSSEEEPASGEKNCKSPRRPGLRRLSASFKRRDRSRSNSFSADTLPAKFIRTTTVKPQTLNPTWNETFRLDIDDIHNDCLHLDIWDHDDESSVFDAARKLNEVTGLKGLNRYFKQICQSARSSSGDHVDDFLGCVNIQLEDIPSHGIDKWFALEGRSQRSTIQGKIRLKLSLGTREDRGMAAGEDNWKEVVEHLQLLWIFVEHELAQHKGPSYEWAGDFSQPALTILHQHAIQGDVTELQQALCRWIVYARKHMEVPLDYALLYQLLDDLDKAWRDDDNSLTQDEGAALAECFNMFLDYSLSLLKKHRDLFPAGNKHGHHKLSFMLKCLALCHRTKAFKRCCPFRSELHLEVVTALKKGAQEFFSTRQAYFEPQVQSNEAVLRSLIDLVNSLNDDLQKGLMYYDELFESLVGVNYSSVIYKQLEKLVAEETGPKVEETCNGITATVNRKNECSPEKISSGTAMFELYMALQEFVRFRENLPEEEWDQLTISEFHLWFVDTVHQWFTVAKVKARQRIAKALELDKVNFVDSLVKHSTSAVDTTTCFSQIKEFWKQLDWPDRVTAYPFIIKVLEDICSSAVYYATLSHQKLIDAGYFTEDGKFDVTEQLCITINNIEHVRCALKPLPDDLGLAVILQGIELTEGEKAVTLCRTTVFQMLHSAEDDVVNKILSIVHCVVEKMRPEIKKSIFHLAWAPEKVDAENAIGPLMKYLDANLKTLYNNLLQTNFDRVLETIWTVVLQELTFTSRSNIGKEKTPFFERLHNSLSLLVDFFHANGKGLPMQNVYSPSYQDLLHLLKLHQSDSKHLIELYCLQRIEEQQNSKTGQFGYLTAKFSYNVSTESLCIDVLNARELIPLDPTGFSDPFVIVELMPKHFFPDCPMQKTKVHKKTLYPLFDESFEFNVSYERCKQEGSAVCFTVMDHDVVTTNDFEGEAWMPLVKIPGIAEEPLEVKAEEFALLRPSEKNEIICALEARTWDKDAKDFLKQQAMKKS